MPFGSSRVARDRGSFRESLRTRQSVNYTSLSALPQRCHTMPQRLALHMDLVAEHANNGTIIATFTNNRASHFALNWARALHSLGLRSLVGMAQRLGPEVERSFRAVGSGLFCADGKQMLRNGQAGRWAEVMPLLRAGFHVLLSDSDIGWLRNPLPYFALAARVHPRLDFALLTDRVFNTYSSEPLRVPSQSSEPMRARQRAALEVDLELEPATENAYPSLNIGVIFFYAHALPALHDLLGAFARSVEGPDGKLSEWDQEPINKHVLRPGHARDREDGLLMRVFGGRLSMGVLPMLQFTTSFTYFMFKGRTRELGARPYCIHAIFSHGKEMERKRLILREAMAWHDEPDYYTRGRYMRADLTIPSALRAEGGFEMIEVQLQQFRTALRLARALNRTLILPRLKCDDRAMAYPCYAWYHRAMGYNGLNFFQKVSMPEHCPPYYWLDATALSRFAWPTREPSFLDNPRTPASWGEKAATLHLCARSPCAPAPAGLEAAARPTPRRIGEAEVRHPGRTRLAHLLTAAEPLATARVIVVEHLHALALPPQEAVAAPSWDDGVRAISHTMWCSPCPITRRGAVVRELNRSARREVEHFCRVESRARLGWDGYTRRSCCPQPTSPRVGACRTCSASERRPSPESTLPWHVKPWLSAWAHLRDPAEYAALGGGWRCYHPLCTGTDRQHFP